MRYEALAVHPKETPSYRRRRAVGIVLVALALLAVAGTRYFWDGHGTRYLDLDAAIAALESGDPHRARAALTRIYDHTAAALSTMRSIERPELVAHRDRLIARLRKEVCDG